MSGTVLAWAQTIFLLRPEIESEADRQADGPLSAYFTPDHQHIERCLRDCITDIPWLIQDARLEEEKAAVTGNRGSVEQVDTVV